MPEKKLSLLCLTGNKGKRDEFAELFKGSSMTIDMLDADLREVQSADIEYVGRHKMRDAVERHKKKFAPYDAVFCDDTALLIKCMNDLPGPFIKWYLNGLGINGIWDFVGKHNNRAAEAVCTLSVFTVKTEEIRLFSGRVRGRITAPDPEDGFGWDPIFTPDASRKTFARMSAAEKNNTSHRAMAVEQLKTALLRITTEPCS